MANPGIKISTAGEIPPTTLNIDSQSVGSEQSEQSMNGSIMEHRKCRYPFCIVWTPIPILSWLFPIIGHMGIATSTGIIRDFAGPYFVSEDNMAFGKPTRYWKLQPSKAFGGAAAWDKAIAEASDVYTGRMHNLCCDNCHSHVAMALNLMKYDGSTSWNMVKLCFLMIIYGKTISIPAFLKTWLPFSIILTVAIILGVLY